MVSWIDIESAADGLFLSVIKSVPQLLLAILVVVVTALIAKDILNGLRRPFLVQDRWLPVPIVDRKELSHNVRQFRFALPHADQKLGLPTGQHITLKVVKPDGTEVMRPYTPISEVTQRGYVDFVIKVYPEGKMSRALDELKVGDRIFFKGPKGRFIYKPSAYKTIGMLAGGTGVTPMYQLIQTVLRDPNDKTEISLIFANVNEEDILLHRELEELAAKHKRFKTHYVLNNPPANWTGSAGFITEDIIRERIAPPSEDVLVLRCGPPPMTRAMEAYLTNLGYPSDNLFAF